MSHSVYIGIAGANIRIKSYSENDSLILPESFQNYMIENLTESHIQIDACEVINTESMVDPEKVVSFSPSTGLDLPKGAELPTRLWEVKARDSGYRISTWSFTGREYLPVWIDFIPGNKRLVVYTVKFQDGLFPLGYPAGALMIYLVSTLVPGLLVHASVVEDCGLGYMFAGLSGAGKTTMASIWEASGATVVHDDRVIIRYDQGCWNAYSTPVNDSDYTGSARLRKLFIIQHGSQNRIRHLTGMEAYAGILEHCIQHQYDRSMIDSKVKILGKLVQDLPVYLLEFFKDQQIVHFIRKLQENE